jgi:hypothetical protein
MNVHDDGLVQYEVEQVFEQGIGSLDGWDRNYNTFHRHCHEATPAHAVINMFNHNAHERAVNYCLARFYNEHDISFKAIPENQL